MTMSRPYTQRQLSPGLNRGKRKNTAQQARAYLYQRHPNGFGISPQKFAAASQETGSSFDDLIKFISRMYAGGAQASTFRQEDLSNSVAGAQS